MTAAEPRRTLSALPARTSLAPDPSVSRLRRDHRAPAQGPDGTTQPTTSDATSAPGTDPAPAAETTSGPSPSTARTAPASRTDTAAAAAGESDQAALPLYLQLVRKEARLRQDQVDDLTRHIRRLNQLRRRRDGVDGERITENTLIRVAVDLLLSRADRLAGATEDQIRTSVTATDAN